MVVGHVELDLYLPSCNSLKDKRQILQSLLDRLHRQFNLSAAEVGSQDLWNRGSIGLACVSGESGHARRVLEEAVRFIEDDGRCEVVARRIDLD